jgi:putative RNA 2'-phosphotransferase
MLVGRRILPPDHEGMESVIMGRDQSTDISKKLSWLLRHRAPSEGIAMDAAGWVAVADVLRVLGLTRDELARGVELNTKSRLDLRGDRIRASQGHSTEGMPVTHDALEASWERFAGEGPIWHGTAVDALPGIVREGIVPQARTHVHLTDALDSKVGKRASVHVMIEVSVARLGALGIGVFQSQNGVVLARRVPPSAITGIVALSARAKRDEPALRALFAEGR